MASFSGYIEPPDGELRNIGPQPDPYPPARHILDSYESLTKAIQNRKNQRVPLNVSFITTTNDSDVWERIELKNNIKNILKTHDFLECSPMHADVIISQGLSPPTCMYTFFMQVLGPRSFTGEVTEQSRAVADEFMSAIETHRAKGLTEAHFFTWME